MKTTKAFLAALVVAAVIIGGTYAYLQYGIGSGTLVIGFTDAPVAGVSHIYLTMTDIQLDGPGNTSVNFGVNATTFDLLSLLNVTKMLGSNAVPAGNYTMIRFSVTSAEATISGHNTTLTVPSSQIKLPLSFSVVSGKTTTVVVDVTADMTNVSASGNLRPVATVKSIAGPT